MRFSLLCASTALAASLVLSACSSGGSSSAIPGGTSIGYVPDGPQSWRLPSGNGRQRYPAAQTCQSPFDICYVAAPGTTTQFGWCLSSSGNCTSGVYAGKVKWANDNGCGPRKAVSSSGNASEESNRSGVRRRRFRASGRQRHREGQRKVHQAVRPATM